MKTPPKTPLLNKPETPLGNFKTPLGGANTPVQETLVYGKWKFFPFVTLRPEELPKKIMHKFENLAFCSKFHKFYGYFA